jgi:hypothetical protein
MRRQASGQRHRHQRHVRHHREADRYLAAAAAEKLASREWLAAK